MDAPTEQITPIDIEVTQSKVKVKLLVFERSHGQCQTVGLKSKCCLLNILGSRSNYRLQTIELYPASQKFIPYFAIKARRLSLASNLLNNQFETSLHACKPFKFCTRGTFMFLKQFLFSLQTDCLEMYEWQARVLRTFFQPRSPPDD